jgi:uroporphyrin-III C-methyltransferase
MSDRGTEFPTLPDFAPGSVWLVGAGPGDPGLLSLLGYHALRAADDIVYDALVGEGILALAGARAELHYAGKRGGKPSAKQADISDKLISLARAGRRVLRLKGGDPFIFGRGGEEALALAAAGVPFRLVPGITAAVAGLAYAGIPITDRRVNSAVTLITGHEAGGGPPEGLDWPALASGAPVLILYMALKHLAWIAERLMEAGRGGDTAVILIAKATLADQRIVETNLADAAKDAAAAGLEAPAIIAVGDVIGLRAALDPAATPEARARAALAFFAAREAGEVGG